MPPASNHDTVLEAGSVQARIARVYAEALLAAALKQPNADAPEALGRELDEFVTGVLDANPQVGSYLASPAIGRKTKTAALAAALPGHASELIRGLLGVLTHNGRLGLFRGIAEAYGEILDQRAGRVPVKVTAASELSDAQKTALTRTLAGMLKGEPMLSVRVDPDLIGGMVIQVGDRVIDTSVRTRLQNLRTLLLDKGGSYGAAL
jgi:F-type H+-transporting ATPase subunit delta